MSPTINLGPKKKPTRSRNKDFYQGIYSDTRWIRIREFKRRENPICERCEVEGRTTQMEDVHHLLPWNNGNTQYEIEELAFSIENTISVCKKCHATYHRELRIDPPK